MAKKPTQLRVIQRNLWETATLFLAFLPLIPQRFAELDKKPTQLSLNPRNLWEIMLQNILPR